MRTEQTVVHRKVRRNVEVASRTVKQLTIRTVEDCYRWIHTEEEEEGKRGMWPIIGPWAKNGIS
ncbi:unnamed protein product [Arabis nemorensis]|uniref:Uncharacterized protein n=1 Tax=Arabis nemorensis TaxID=586526 RepID=A0A565CLR2_9BRAS|nr:unnamed protein product [Arabis nemorensis]